MTGSVVITGAGQGIGRAILHRLLEDGWYAVGVERDTALVEDLNSAIKHGEGAVLHADVAEANTLERARDLAVAAAPLAGWVNNAGVPHPVSLHRATPADLATVLSVNLHGTFWGCAMAVRTFLAQKSPGAIVNVSSIHGRASFAGHAAYDTSKGGIDALTRNVAVEYGPAGIRANAVAPGGIRTPLLLRGIAEADDPATAESRLRDSPPLRRIGEATEIAAVVAFLLSADASYLTGQSIAVDGGWTAACATSPTDPDLMRGRTHPMSEGR